MDERLANILEALSELSTDSTVPKNVKAKLVEIITLLNSEDDLSMSINKVLGDLDDIADDSNLQTYTRTQIWNIASMLEMISA